MIFNYSYLLRYKNLGERTELRWGELCGVAYSKARSLIPLFVGHYLHNYLANILATIIL